MVSNDGIKIGLAGDAYMRRGVVLAVFFAGVVLAASLAVGLAAVQPAAAQTAGNNTTANTTTDTATNTTNASTPAPGTPTDTPDTPDTTESNAGDGNASTPAGDGETIESDDRTSIDSNLDVVEWEYDSANERFIITFESESVTGSRVSLSEQVDTDRGVTRYNIRQERITGTETIEFDARQWGGEAGVSIVTQRALQETGTGVIISTGERDGSDPFNTPGTMGWFGGVTVGVVTGLVAFRRRLRGGNGGPKSAWGEW
jgi:hypothetical protein